ncbi:hypothetical protein ACFE04_001532 [Oxalis oulophora]
MDLAAVMTCLLEAVPPLNSLSGSIVCKDDSSEGYEAMDVGLNKGFEATNAILGRILNAPELHDTMPDDKKVATVGAIIAQLLYLDAIDPNKDIVMYINSPRRSVTAVFMPGDLLCSIYDCKIARKCIPSINDLMYGGGEPIRIFRSTNCVEEVLTAWRRCNKDFVRKKRKEEEKLKEKELNELFKVVVSQPKVPVASTMTDVATRNRFQLKPQVDPKKSGASIRAPMKLTQQVSQVRLYYKCKHVWTEI